MKKLLSQLESYLDWLETPNDMFGGQPVCPFLASDRKNNKLKTYRILYRSCGGNNIMSVELLEKKGG